MIQAKWVTACLLWTWGRVDRLCLSPQKIPLPVHCSTMARSSAGDSTEVDSWGWATHLTEGLEKARWVIACLLWIWVRVARPRLLRRVRITRVRCSTTTRSSAGDAIPGGS